MQPLPRRGASSQSGAPHTRLGHETPIQELTSLGSRGRTAPSEQKNGAPIGLGHSTLAESTMQMDSDHVTPSQTHKGTGHVTSGQRYPTQTKPGNMARAQGSTMQIDCSPVTPGQKHTSRIGDGHVTSEMPGSEAGTPQLLSGHSSMQATPASAYTGIALSQLSTQTSTPQARQFKHPRTVSPAPLPQAEQSTTATTGATTEPNTETALALNAKGDVTSTARVATTTSETISAKYKTGPATMPAVVASTASLSGSFDKTAIAPSATLSPNTLARTVFGPNSGTPATPAAAVGAAPSTTLGLKTLPRTSLGPSSGASSAGIAETPAISSGFVSVDATPASTVQPPRKFAVSTPLLPRSAAAVAGASVAGKTRMWARRVRECWKMHLRTHTLVMLLS